MRTSSLFTPSDQPQTAALGRDPDALAIFMGPYGYISPSWLTDRTQAPTWNYTTAHLALKVELLPTIEAAKAAVEALSWTMEQDRPKAWSPQEMGERYGRLLPGIVAFRSPVISMESKFKLGQNERLDVLKEIMTGLAPTSNRELHRYMVHANRTRLAENESQDEEAVTSH